MQTAFGEGRAMQIALEEDKALQIVSVEHRTVERKKEVGARY